MAEATSPTPVPSATRRVLTGLQPSGQLHLGNYLGTIRQLIDMQSDHEMFVFVASYHALTSVRDADELRANVRQVVIDYLAFGLDPQRCRIYLQQDVPRVTELAWLLGCVCPVSWMDKMVSYKDKVAKGLVPSIGLYTYPVLQAADILIVNPDLVPVGQDQVQHVEITRDIAQRFNHEYGETFRIPEHRVRAGAGVVPGVDGQKMSKSYDNTIDPFMDEKPLRKRIMKIVTDSTPVDEPKDPEGDATFQIFAALAGREDERTRDLEQRYREGGMGYGHAKQALFELIVDELAQPRRRRAELAADPGYIERVLAEGGAVANAEADLVLDRALRAVGLR